MNNMSKAKLISLISLLALICVCTFLVSKYIVRSRIDNDEMPIDTSTRI